MHGRIAQPRRRAGIVHRRLPRRAFAELMAADPDAFRTKFRKMAADPFAFYRGSACLFYADVAGREDRWADERTSRVWIQGDLHAENFGTYMDGVGSADLRRQRLRRGVRRALHLGSAAVRREHRPDVLAEGTFRRGDHRADRDVRARVRPPGPVVRRRRGRFLVLAQPRDRARRRVVGAAVGPPVNPSRDARTA